MDNINIKDSQYKDFDFNISIKQKEFKEKWITELEHFTRQKQGIIINNAPNRIGKTINTLEFFLEKDLKVLYLSDRHPQISEVEKRLQNDLFVHWWGLERACALKNDPEISLLIENDLPTGIICQGCPSRENCSYHSQFQIVDKLIIGGPKEFLPFKNVQTNRWDVIIFDELVEKSFRIEPCIPSLTEEIFNKYGIDSFHESYATVKTLVEQDKIKLDGNSLLALENEAKEIREIALSNVAKKIKKESIRNQDQLANLLQFLNGFPSTVKYLEYCSNYGKRPYFLKPYLHYVFNLIEQDKSSLIMLNTSLKRDIFKLVTFNQDNHIGNPNVFNFPIVNPNSVLLHYRHPYQRSCRKSALFEYDDKIKIDNEGIPVINKEEYGKEILDIAMGAIEHCKENGLSTGIITFKDVIKLFKDKVDVISHFGGHQGSNQFDDIDALIIYGTYNINPTGLYEIYYSLTNEFLGDRHADWNNYKFINGMRMTFSDNEKLNLIKEYKLHEEHGQAIYRSGAHVKDRKIVIAFGFVPEGVENILSYSKFYTKRGVKISISKWLKKLNA